MSSESSGNVQDIIDFSATFYVAFVLTWNFNRLTLWRGDVILKLISTLSRSESPSTNQILSKKRHPESPGANIFVRGLTSG